MASETDFMLRSLLLSHSCGLICLEGGLVVCPLSVSLSSEDAKSRALSMLSKTLAFSLSCAGGLLYRPFRVYGLISENETKQTNQKKQTKKKTKNIYIYVYVYIYLKDHNN